MGGEVSPTEADIDGVFLIYNPCHPPVARVIHEGYHPG